MRISQRQLLVSPNWQVSYYGYDGGGSVRQLTDTTGAVTDTYSYDAFGNTVAQTGTTFNQFLYRGEQFDSTLGMYYLRARYYRPQTGRFLTQDKYEGHFPKRIPSDACPTCAIQSAIQGMACKSCSCVSFWSSPIPSHKYLYVGADPIDKLDPSGQLEYALPIGGIILPSAEAVAAAGLATAKLVLFAGITVFVASKITEELDCSEQRSQCHEKCVEDLALLPHFDNGDYRKCMRLCLSEFGTGCEDNY
jgi:RHS repeat-associated protein